MAQAQRQLGLYESTAHARAGSAASAVASTALRRLPREESPLRVPPDDDDDPTLDRPRALCFECFRVEVTRRQLVRERMARGWNATQVGCRCRKRCGHSTSAGGARR